MLERDAIRVAPSRPRCARGVADRLQSRAPAFGACQAHTGGVPSRVHCRCSQCRQRSKLHPRTLLLTGGKSGLRSKAPRRALEARVGRTRDMVARVIKPSQGEGSLTSSFLAMLPAHTGRMRPAPEGVVRENALDPVAVPLAQRTHIMTPNIYSPHSLAVVSWRAG